MPEPRRPSLQTRAKAIRRTQPCRTPLAHRRAGRSGGARGVRSSQNFVASLPRFSQPKITLAFTGKKPSKAKPASMHVCLPPSRPSQWQCQARAVAAKQGVWGVWHFHARLQAVISSRTTYCYYDIPRNDTTSNALSLRGPLAAGRAGKGAHLQRVLTARSGDDGESC